MEFNYLEKVQTLSKKKDICNLSMFNSKECREDIRVVPQLPTPGVYTKFPTSAVTFILPSAHLHSHLCVQPTNQRCEQTTDVDIKLRGKYGSFCVSYPD